MQKVEKVLFISFMLLSYVLIRITKKEIISIIFALLFLLIVIDQHRKLLLFTSIFFSIFIVSNYVVYAIFNKIYYVETYIFSIVFCIFYLKEYQQSPIIKKVKEFSNMIIKNYFFISLLLLILLYRITYFIILSPDGQSYLLTAKYIQQFNTPFINLPLIKVSHLFIRRQFEFSPPSNMITVYPLGGIFLLTLFSYLFKTYHFLYVYILYVYITELFIIKNNCDDVYFDNNFLRFKKSFLLYILFSPLLLYFIIFDITMDVVSGLLFYRIASLLYNDTLVLVNKKGQLQNSSLKTSLIRSLDLNNKIEEGLLTVTIFLIKFSTFLFVFILISINWGIYLYIKVGEIVQLKEIWRNKNRFNKKWFLKKIMITLIVVSILYLIKDYLISVLEFYFISSNFWNLYSTMIDNPLFFIKQFLISNLSLTIVFPHYILILIVILSKHNKFIDKITQKIWLLLFSFWEVLIFLWHSVTKNPFAIGSRYFIPVAVYSILLVEKAKFVSGFNMQNIFLNRRKTWRKKTKTILFVLLVISNLFLFLPTHIYNVENKTFLNAIYQSTPPNAIIFSSYYSKIITERNVVVYSHTAGFSSYNETAIVELLVFLKNHSYPLFFIPDGAVGAIKLIKKLTQMDVVFNFSRTKSFSFIENFVSPYPRVLFKITNITIT